jgi:outer membrane immunogenic protein
MHKVAVLAAAVALVGGANIANAADLGGSYKDEPVASYGPGFSWAGLYIGGSAGFGVGDTSTTLNLDYRAVEKMVSDSGSGNGLEIFDYELNGAIYGAHIGYNFQRGNIVFGVEAGINGTDMDGSDSILGPVFTSERELDWYATAVGRLGYASGKTLFYGFGGVAWADVTSTASFLGYKIDEQTETHVGWTAGLGIEHAISDRFIVRVEYSHVDLGEETTSYSLGDYGSLEKDVDVKFDAIKVGASYKFGGRDHLEPMK